MKFKEVNCPVCASATYTVLKKAKDITVENFSEVYKSSSDNELFEQVVKCSGCGLVYLNPLLDASTIIDSYKEAIDDTFITQNQLRIDTFRNSLSELSDYLKLKEPPSELKILDIGCAGGAFLQAAKLLGFTPTGVEPSKYLSNYARTTYGIRVLTGILEEQNFENEKFDLITMWDVIEHISNPNITLIEIKKLLKDDSFLVVNYPDYTSITSRLLGWKWPFWLSVHLLYFDKKTITRLLNSNGYEVLRFKMHWQKLELGYAFKRAAKNISFFGIFEKAVKLIGLYNMPIYYYLGQVQVVARIKK